MINGFHVIYENSRYLTSQFLESRLTPRCLLSRNFHNFHHLTLPLLSNMSAFLTIHHPVDIEVL